MFFIIGAIVVFASVYIGYTSHLGEIRLLWQPHEFLIILGTAFGAAIIANSREVVLRSITSIKLLFKGQAYVKQDYLDLLLFCFSTFKTIKSKGILVIESHIDNPQDSELFSHTPSVMRNHTALNFIRDNIRMMLLNVEKIDDFEMIIDKEIEVIEHNKHQVSQTYLSLGDALPALGIVAAVLGVIVTMKSILEPPEVLGSLIAAALVGTFTGVLLSYGLFSPIGNYLSKYFDQEVIYLECIKSGFMAYFLGYPPMVIVEFMRKTIPENIKPSFTELEEHLNNKSIQIL